MFDRSLNEFEYIEELLSHEMFADGILITDKNGIIKYIKYYREEVSLFNEKKLSVNIFLKFILIWNLKIVQ